MIGTYFSRLWHGARVLETGFVKRKSETLGSALVERAIQQ